MEADVARRQAAQSLQLLRCDRCRHVLYGAPNGVAEGDVCGAPMVAEFLPGDVLVRVCFGRFELIGKSIRAKSA